jgi:hypothetical protein
VTNRLAYHIYIGSIPVIQALVYAVVIVCALRIRRFVNRHFKGPNEAKRRDVNRQMNTNMLIQA